MSDDMCESCCEETRLKDFTLCESCYAEGLEMTTEDAIRSFNERYERKE